MARLYDVVMVKEGGAIEQACYVLGIDRRSRVLYALQSALPEKLDTL